MTVFKIHVYPKASEFDVRLVETAAQAKQAGFANSEVMGMFWPNLNTPDAYTFTFGEFVFRAKDNQVSGSLIAHEVVHGVHWVHRQLGKEAWQWFDYRHFGYTKGEQREEAFCRQVQALHGQICAGITTHYPHVKVRPGN